MKRLAAIALLLAVAFVSNLAPARAGGSSYITTNNTSDAYVWVTAYKKHMIVTTTQAGAWCVAPHKDDTHGLTTLVVAVRTEISRNHCQGNPVVVNHLRDTKVNDPVKFTQDVSCGRCFGYLRL